jgi:hypothetical protein
VCSVQGNKYPRSRECKGLTVAVRSLLLARLQPLLGLQLSQESLCQPRAARVARGNARLDALPGAAAAAAAAAGGVTSCHLPRSCRPRLCRAARVRASVAVDTCHIVAAQVTTCLLAAALPAQSICRQSLRLD